jgi:hypothetical protein
MPLVAALLALSALSALSGCGKEVGRLHFAAEGAGATTLALKKGTVDFWTDIGIEYTPDAALLYRIELVQNGASVGMTTCNPLGRMSTKTMWVESNIGSTHSRSGQGKMSCSVDLAEGGQMLVRASLAFSPNKPAAAVLKQADLVVKQ